MKEKLKEKINLVLIAAAVAVVVVGAACFYGGTKYASMKRFSAMGAGGPIGQAGTAKNRQASAQSFFNGDVIAKDDASMTIKMRNGGSKIVFFSASTEIGKFVSGTLADVNVGSYVMVTSKTNTDGSVTAQSIQIRPAGETEPAPGGAPAGGGSSPSDAPQQ